MQIFKFLKNKLKISKALIILLGVVIFSLFAFGFLKDTKSLLVLAADTTSPDAIAIRVIPNPDHHGISRWYNEQGFKGSPQALTIDGYEALRDGRTVYVNAANVVGDELYTNIYLISYNQDAEAATKSILDQIISHWKFNTNIAGSEQKARITRDTKRLSRLAEIKIAVENYKEDKGYYPKLAAGTYLANKTISTWPSWQQTLAKELGVGLPTDPINKLGECLGYDSATCWKESDKTFAGTILADGALELPADSNALVYTAAADGSSYNVCAIMESGLVSVVLSAGACAGSAIETVQYGETAINHPPTITCNNLIGNPNKAFKGYIGATDPDGNPLTWSVDTSGTTWTGWSAAPTLESLTANPNQISATTAGVKGTYSFKVTVSDNKEGGSVTKTCSISITDSALPIVTPIVDKEIVIGKTLDFMIYATDPNGNYPFSAFSFNPSLISCNITNEHDCRVQSLISNTFSLNQDGGDNMYKNYTISVSTANSLGVASPSQSFNLKVINHKPVVSIPASCGTKVRINNNYNPCSVTASDPDGHSIDSFSFSGFPNGMTGNVSTGEISGRPDAAGSYTIIITATDQYGAESDSKNLNLKVNTYCGDGTWQATNGEGMAEKCDKTDNIAATYDVSSINKQYACDSSCQFTGGYCKDGIVQNSKGEGEVCDFGNNINCCADCQWTCPPYQAQSLNFVGGSEKILGNDESTNLILPACRVFEAGSAKIDASLQTETVGTAIVYVTDTSGSMSGQIEIVKTALAKAINDMHDKAVSGANISIGLVRYSGSVSSEPIVDISDNINESNLVSKISAYPASGGTDTKDGVTAAYNMLASFSAKKKIIVLLSDGDPSSGQNPASYLTNTVKPAGILIYTIAYTTKSSLQTAMCGWSSDNGSNCPPSPAASYAYTSTDASQVYDDITNNILMQPTGRVDITINGVNSFFEIPSITNIPLDLSGVACSDNNQNLDFKVNFGGGGMIKFYNARFNYCPACSP